MTLSQEFASYFSRVDMAADDVETLGNAKSRIIDFIAVTAAARYYSDIPSKLTAYANALHGGSAYSPSTVGFLNAAQAHCLDYDDGHLWAGIHAAGPVIGTAFALAPRFRSTGRRLLAAIVAGYEIDYRLGKALGKSHIKKGFHGSCTCGVVAAAVTAGLLAALDERQMTHAIGLAGLAASGYRQPLAEGQMAKPVQVGYAAERGIAAALLAKEGVEAPLRIFEGGSGLFQVFSDEPVDRICEACLAGLGTRPLINDTYTKLYPCCRYTHAAIEASFKLRSLVPSPDGVREIMVKTFDIAVDATAPNQEPESAGEARFSMNYLLAVALHQGFVGVDDFTAEAILRGDIRRTARKVKTIATREWNDVYPGVRGAEVVVAMYDGTTHSQTVDRLSGMSGDHDEVRRKYFNASRKAFTEQRAREIVNLVERIDRCEDTSELAVIQG